MATSLSERKLDSADEKSGIPIDHSPSEDSRDVETTSISEKALVRKLDLKLLPAVSILYLLSFLDRSNGSLVLPLVHVVC